MRPPEPKRTNLHEKYDYPLYERPHASCMLDKQRRIS
jgi:hypothetical protein